MTSAAALGRETSISGRYSGVETGVTLGVGATSRALSSVTRDLTQGRAIPGGQVLSVPHPDARTKSTAMVETAPVEETKEPDPHRIDADVACRVSINTLGSQKSGDGLWAEQAPSCFGYSLTDAGIMLAVHVGRPSW